MKLEEIVKDENLKRWLNLFLQEFDWGDVGINAGRWLLEEDEDHPLAKEPERSEKSLHQIVADQVLGLSFALASANSPGLKQVAQRLQKISEDDNSDYSNPKDLKRVSSAVNEATKVIRANGPAVLKSMTEQDKKQLTDKLWDFSSTMKNEFHRIKKAKGVKAKLKTGLKSLAVAGLKLLSITSFAVAMVAKKAHPFMLKNGKELGVIAGTVLGTAIAGGTDGAMAPVIPLMAYAGGTVGERLFPKLAVKVNEYAMKFSESMDHKANTMHEKPKEKSTERLLESRQRLLTQRVKQDDAEVVRHDTKVDKPRPDTI